MLTCGFAREKDLPQEPVRERRPVALGKVCLPARLSVDQRQGKERGPRALLAGQGNVTETPAAVTPLAARPKATNPFAKKASPVKAPPLSTSGKRTQEESQPGMYVRAYQFPRARVCARARLGDSARLPIMHWAALLADGGEKRAKAALLPFKSKPKGASAAPENAKKKKASGFLQWLKENRKVQQPRIGFAGIFGVLALTQTWTLSVPLQTLAQEHPGMQAKELAKRAGEVWRGLSAEEKAKWNGGSSE
jgi:hypothetical protein